MASEQLKKVFEIARSQRLSAASPIEQARANMERVSERVANDVQCDPVDAGGVAAEWISISGISAERIILYLHGGGYVIGSVNTHRATIARIARASKATALAIDYRLAPEFPFPAALLDASAAYKWLLMRGYSPSSIVIAGDSAGGGLTLATLLSLRDSRAPLPAAAVLISPWTDLAGTGDSMVTRAAQDPMVSVDALLGLGKLYFGTTDPQNPLISPLYAKFQGLPPMLIQVGTAEILHDDATRVADRAKTAGVQTVLEVSQDMVHVWHMFAKILPEGQKAIDQIGSFVIAHTSIVIDLIPSTRRSYKH